MRKGGKNMKDNDKKDGFERDKLDSLKPGGKTIK